MYNEIQFKILVVKCCEKCSKSLPIYFSKGSSNFLPSVYSSVEGTIIWRLQGASGGDSLALH